MEHRKMPCQFIILLAPEGFILSLPQQTTVYLQCPTAPTLDISKRSSMVSTAGFSPQRPRGTCCPARGISCPSRAGQDPQTQQHLIQSGHNSLGNGGTEGVPPVPAHGGCANTWPKVLLISVQSWEGTGGVPTPPPTQSCSVLTLLSFFKISPGKQQLHSKLINFNTLIFRFASLLLLLF